MEAAGIVRADCVYGKKQLALVLGISDSALDRLLSDLAIKPLRPGTACPLISGRLFVLAVEREQARCQP